MATSYCQLTLQQRQAIIDAFHGGMECRQIQVELAVSKRAVAGVLAEAKINTKRRNRYSLDETYFDTIDSQTKAYPLKERFTIGEFIVEKISEPFIS